MLFISLDLTVFDVTEADTTEAALARSRACTRPTNEPTKEKDYSSGKKDDAMITTRSPEIQSENHVESVVDPSEERTLETSLWGGTEDGEHDTMFDDREATATLAPLVRKTSDRKKHKPRFRSTRKK